MVQYSILIVIYIIGVFANAWLIYALLRFRNEYIAKRIIALPVAVIIQKLVIILALILRIIHDIPYIGGKFLFLLAASAAILPASVAGYLAGVFTGRWNTWMDTPDQYNKKNDEK